MSLWANFWDLIWWFLWVFIFVAYLMALFTIIGDLFRDNTMNGWAKAVWVVALIFVPFITVLVYLIARGKGMAERRSHDEHVAQAATDDYIRFVARKSPTDEIEKAKMLMDAGTITPEQYETLKARALAST